MPSYAVPPRPILKHSSPSSSPKGSHPHHHAVHFPPPPSLTCTFSAHSGAVYDRSPIVIAPNACTLPERGCPGRTYYGAEDTSSRSSSSSRRVVSSSANTKHPRAFATYHTLLPSEPPSSCPALVPDLSSESEESDGFASIPEPQCHLASPSHTYNVKGLAVTITRPEDPYLGYYMDGTATPATLDATTALSFLPYPPSPLVRSSCPRNDDDESSLRTSKPRRRRSSRSRERKQERNETPRGSERASADVQDQNRGRRSKPSSRTKSSDRALSICGSFSSFGIQDDASCLGGF